MTNITDWKLLNNNLMIRVFSYTCKVATVLCPPPTLSFSIILLNAPFSSTTLKSWIISWNTFTAKCFTYGGHTIPGIYIQERRYPLTSTPVNKMYYFSVNSVHIRCRRIFLDNDDSIFEKSRDCNDIQKYYIFFL